MAENKALIKEYALCMIKGQSWVFQNKTRRERDVTGIFICTF